MKNTHCHHHHRFHRHSKTDRCWWWCSNGEDKIILQNIVELLEVKEIAVVTSILFHLKWFCYLPSSRLIFETFARIEQVARVPVVVAVFYVDSLIECIKYKLYQWQSFNFMQRVPICIEWKKVDLLTTATAITYCALQWAKAIFAQTSSNLIYIKGNLLLLFFKLKANCKFCKIIFYYIMLNS